MDGVGFGWHTGNGIVYSKSIAVTSCEYFGTIPIDNGIKFVIHTTYGDNIHKSERKD